MIDSKQIKVYVIHVSTNLKREQHIKTMLKQKSLDANAIFINDGDIKDLNTDILSKYFINSFTIPSPGSSCTYKHLLAMEAIAKDQKYALVFEDDIFLERKFNEVLVAIQKEIEIKKMSNFLISLEDSLLQYVPGHLRRSDQYLYRATHGRMAGAYIVDSVAASNIIKEAITNKTDQIIDWFHNYCQDKKVINIYWAHPTIAIQGSHNGKIKTTLDSKPGGIVREITFWLQRHYKRLLYFLK